MVRGFAAAIFRIRSSWPAGSDKVRRSCPSVARLPREHDRHVSRGGEARRRFGVLSGCELHLRRRGHRRDRLQRRRVMPDRAGNMDQLVRGTGRRVVHRDAADRLDADEPPPASTPTSARRPITAIFFEAISPKRQQSVAVLKQDDAAFRDSLGDGEARRRIDRLHGLGRVKRAHRGKAAQDATRHVVDARFGDLAFLDCRPSTHPRSSAPRRTPGRGPRSRPARCCGSRPSRT